MTPYATLARAVITQAMKDATGKGMKALAGGSGYYDAHDYQARQTLIADDARRFLTDLKQPGNIWREIIEADS